jgi:hypothetical protein
MSLSFKKHAVSGGPHTPESACGDQVRWRFWLLEWAAGIFAFLLAGAAMLLFLMNTIASRVDTLIDEQNAAALKLSDNLQYFRDHRMRDDASTPPGLFSDLVEFSRNTQTILLEVHRLGVLESLPIALATFGLVREQPEKEVNWPAQSWLRNLLETFGLAKEENRKSWSEDLLDRLRPKNGRDEPFDHTGVDPRTTSGKIFEEGAYQIDLYQSIRDFSQERCTAYKDFGGAISVYLLPLLYALLGAFLCDLRCRFAGAPAEPRAVVSLGSTRYATAIIAGAVLGIFTSLIPTNVSLPPLLIAFLCGYSIDIFIGWLNALIDKILKPNRGT